VITLVVCAFAAAAQDQPEDAKFGRVAGSVVESKSGEAIRKALVLLRRDPNSPAIGALTDASGKFAFRKLEPGSYTVAVERDGWVTARESKTITTSVTAGQAAPAVTLKMVKTAAISGRVVDADGDPLAGASIQVAPEAAKKGGPPSPWALTNDRGEYRAYNVAPGQYRICAVYAARSHRMDVQVQSPTPAAYPKVCFPGNPQGSVYTLEAGADLQGVDFHMAPARAVNVRGHVVFQAPERPLFLMVTLLSTSGTAEGATPEAIVKDADGKFELQGVLPGRYRLRVDGANAGGDARFGATRIIDVADTDLNGVEIAVAPPRRIEGRVMVPEGRKMPPLMVFLAPRDKSDNQAGGMAQVSPKGTFVLAEVGSGEYDVMIGSTGPGDDLYVSGIRMGNSDALADGVRPGVAGDLEILLKGNGGTLNCTVSGDDDQPSAAQHVVLIPDPPRERQLALMGECRTDAKGTCAILGVAPGDYHVYAFPADMEAQRDADAMKAFEQYGKAVKIGEGERREVQVKGVPVQ
jgi:protocatechuate 3,4-dioxygenase beta subunit